MAIELFVRLRNPQMLVSWTRPLAGEWRDPLVGRDILAGCLAGAVAGIVWYAHVTYIALFLVAAVALYAFKTALGGRRVFEFTDA